MAKEDTNVTDRGTPIVPDDDIEWGTKSQIVEGGLFNEQGKDVRVKDEEIDEDDKDKDKDEIIEEVEVPEPTFNVQDPGEYEPKDYSFDVTTYDKEGNNPRTVKVKSVEEWDKLLGDDANFGSAQALMKAERLATKMDSGQERDKADWDKQKKAYDTERTEFEEREGNLDNLVNEMDYLVGRGDMPKIPAKYAGDWTSADAKKNSAVKEQQALISYMDKENRARTKAGLKPETSLVSAYKAYKLDNLEKEEALEQEQSAQFRKQAGARVAGTSPSATTTQAPKGIAVGRGGSLDELSMGNWE